MSLQRHYQCIIILLACIPLRIVVIVNIYLCLKVKTFES